MVARPHICSARALSVLSVTLVVCLAGCGGTSGKTPALRVRGGQLGSSSASIAMVAHIGGPNNAGTSESMQGDSRSAGVWLWTSSIRGSELVHWDQSAESIKRWPVGSTEDDIVPGEPPSIAISRDGTTAWLAQNDELVRSDLASGAQQRFKIPIGPDNAAREGFRPPEVKGTHAAVAVSVAPSGDEVAVALSAVSAVEEFSPTNETFSELPLPTGDDANGLGFLSDGRLVAGISDYATGATTSALVSGATPSDWTSVAVPDSSAVLTSPDGTLLVGGSNTTILSPQLATTPLTGNSTDAILPSLQLPNGNRVIADRDALWITTAKGATVATAPWPTETCSAFVSAPAVSETTAARDATTTTEPSTETCVRQPVAMATDGLGNIWLQFQLSAGLELALVPTSP